MKITKVCVIPDAHDGPDIPKDRFRWIGKHIKKELCSIKDEQKKLSAYANMGKGGLKVVIWLGYIIAVSIGYFVGNKL